MITVYYFSEPCLIDYQGENATGEIPDLSALEGKKLNKAGKVVDEKVSLFTTLTISYSCPCQGAPWGTLVEGDAKKLFGKIVAKDGQVWDDSGKVVGRVELLPDSQRPDALSSPFEDYPESKIDKSGNVIFDGQVIGKLVDGDAKTLAGKKVDADGEYVKHRVTLVMYIDSQTAFLTNMAMSLEKLSDLKRKILDRSLS